MERRLDWLAHTSVGIAPALIWLVWIYSKDRFEPEPKRWVLAVFFAGAASTVLVLGVRPWFEDLLPLGRGLDRAFADAFLLTAPLEEFAKGLAFCVVILGNRHLDEPLDGVIYGAAAGLGFACVENVVYVLDTAEASTALLRGFTATLTHLTTTATLGFGLTLARLARGRRRIGYAAAGVGAAILLHGAYDLFLIAEGGLAWISLVGVLPLACMALGLKIRFARDRSPHRPPAPDRDRR